MSKFSKLWKMFSFYWMLILLLATDCLTAAKNTHRDTLTVENECKESFVPYKNYFLRGVKEEFFVTYNKTTEEECLKYCCLEKHFDCSSFSYFPALKVCYVMNLTKHDDVAQLVPFKGITHYDKAVPTKGTPTQNATTAPETTSQFESTTSTEEKIPATTADAIEITAPTTTQTKLETTQSKVVITTQLTTASSKNDVTTPSLIKSSKVSTKFPKTKPTKSPKILTDAALTTVGAITIAKDVDNPIIFSNELSSKHLENATSYSITKSQAQCLGVCQNGGLCKFMDGKMYGKETSKNKAECICKPGYHGAHCEIESKSEAQVGDESAGGNPAEAGVPIFGIAIGVVGFFVFFLVIGVLAVYVIYRKKTGQYRVKEQRERWNKRTRKNAVRRSQSFLCPDQRSPFGSELNFPDVLDSKGNLSTLTSV